MKDCKMKFIFSVSIFTKLKQGTLEVASNFKLSIGVLTNTQARMNTIIITLFLNLWCKKYIIDKDEAYKTGMMLSGIGQVAGLISSVLFGFIFDKASYSTHLIINNTCIILGYISLIFLEPSNKLCILSFCLVSIGYYGLMTVGYVIVNRNVGHQARGSVMGINSFMGAVGIVFLTKVGGIMFDKVSSLSPFLICSITSFLMIVVMIIPYFNNKLNNSENMQKDDMNYRKLSDEKVIENEEKEENKKIENENSDNGKNIVLNCGQ